MTAGRTFSNTSPTTSYTLLNDSQAGAVTKRGGRLTGLLLALLLAGPLDAGLERSMEDAARAAQGRVGAAVVVVESGSAASFHGDQRFPMQSVYKFPIAMAVLHEVDEGRLSLERKIRVEHSDLVTPAQHSPIRDAHPDGGVEYTLRELARLSVAESDGTACDVLLRVLGGTESVQTYLHSLGIDGVRVVTTEKEMGLDEQAQYRNWATPSAMARLLRAFQEGRGLSAASRSLLMAMMIQSPTGPKRLKGRLPDGTPVAHKTGTSRTRKGVTAATNDVGLITLPDGRHVAVAVFVSDSNAADDVRERVIADIARAAWEAAQK